MKYGCSILSLCLLLVAAACSTISCGQSKQPAKPASDTTATDSTVHYKSIFSKLEQSVRSGAFDTHEASKAAGKTQPSRSSRTPPANPHGITNHNVRSLIASVDSALSAKDVDKVMSHFAPSFKAAISHQPSGGGKQILSKSGFKSQISKVLNRAGQYSNRRYDVSIRIGRNGRSATYESNQHETITIGKRTVQDTTHQILQIKLVKNTPMITKLTSTPSA